ncbi:MAG: adenylyl-sulfate kinase, partial [Calditrichota bacterium]
MVDKQAGFTLWFTGLSGAGKTSVTKRLAELLRSRGYNVE